MAIGSTVSKPCTNSTRGRKGCVKSSTSLSVDAAPEQTRMLGHGRLGHPFSRPGLSDRLRLSLSLRMRSASNQTDIRTSFRNDKRYFMQSENINKGGLLKSVASQVSRSSFGPASVAVSARACPAARTSIVNQRQGIFSHARMLLTRVTLIQIHGRYGKPFELLVWFRKLNLVIELGPEFLGII